MEMDIQDMMSIVSNLVNNVSMKYCTKCGSEIPDDAKFCTKCGRPVDQETSSQPKHNSTENKATVNKKAQNAFFAVMGLLILIVLGSIFYSDYSEKREARIARENFVEDSIKKAKLEEERLQMEEELRIKAEKDFAQFLKDFTIEKLIDLISNPTNERYAQRCGLSQVYRIATEEEYGEDLDLVYGRAIEKGHKLDYGYQLISNSEHSCYFRYHQDTSSGAELCFKKQEDANLFWKKARDYGLFKYEETYMIPRHKIAGGGVLVVDGFEYDGENGVLYILSPPQYNDGFYVLHIGIDF